MWLLWVVIFKEKMQGVLYLSRADHYSYWMDRLNTYIFDRLNQPIIRRRFRKLDISSYDVIWLTKYAAVLRLLNRELKRITYKFFMELNEFNDIYKGKGATGNILQRVVGRQSNAIFV